MKTILLGGALPASAISLGCMRMASLTQKEASDVIHAALESGVNFFDHADIYGGGKSEEVFAQAIAAEPGLRGRILLQSKCGIRQGSYDFSKEHILKAVDGSLKRLKTDYLDLLVLHRPDALVEPEEVAEAFDTLQRIGKVRYFGVSNHNPQQIELLGRSLTQKLLVDQLQLSLTNTGMIDRGINVNMTVGGSVDRDGGVLDYCRLNHITIQAWSPFQYGFFEGVFIGSEKYPALNSKLGEIAAARGVTPSAIAAAWILRHPADIQTIIGSMNPTRIREICKAGDIRLTRGEWYDLYLAAGNKLP